LDEKLCIETLLVRFLFALIAGLFVLFNVTNIKAEMAEEIDMNFNKLSPQEERVIIHKGTEMPYSGKYHKHREKGLYLCKRCGAALYRSEDKFDSNCGWPSFDDEIAGAVKKAPDRDGVRTEIICNNCGAHLGHVFTGEEITDKNVRHCVNSISLNFVAQQEEFKLQKAYFAGGCFWGTEYIFQNFEGVISTRVGYMGGQKHHPTYHQVCSGTTGHAEVLEVDYDPGKITYEELAKLFFEIHDPAQVNRQGPDIGEQYRSEIFYTDDEQKRTAEKLIKILKEKDYKIATRLSRAGKFWEAEEYHQDYYQNRGLKPYYHVRENKF